MLHNLATELRLRKREMGHITVETIYFGGGTPSVLELEELQFLIDTVYDHYAVIDRPEITLEANPDDLTAQKIIELGKGPVNRLSIGIQSFFDRDLKLMNRAHNATEAEDCLKVARQHFGNISIDLIYGIPGQDDREWTANIEKSLAYDIPHISSYALTVEPRTALHKFVEKGVVPKLDDVQAQEQFYLLEDRLDKEGFVNYEISNFGKSGFFSRNNTAYWQGKPYLGIGPSAHSFNGRARGWNVANNPKYIRALEKDELPITWEDLSVTDRYNEYVMTGLRTIWGVSLSKIESEFGQVFGDYFTQQANKYVGEHLLFWEADVLRATKKGKFLVDGIASDLFKINLKQ